MKAVFLDANVLCVIRWIGVISDGSTAEPWVG